jgi:hypothetical protein
MQTYENEDSAGMRYSDLTPTSVKLYIEEEKSGDTEVTSPAEVVGYLALWTEIRPNDTNGSLTEPTMPEPEPGVNYV